MHGALKRRVLQWRRDHPDARSVFVCENFVARSACAVSAAFRSIMNKPDEKRDSDRRVVWRWSGVRCDLVDARARANFLECG